VGLEGRDDREDFTQQGRKTVFSRHPMLARSYERAAHADSPDKSMVYVVQVRCSILFNF